MSLFNQFISSAIRQIGRDGGKIISKKIYGFSTQKTQEQYSSINDVTDYSELGYAEGDKIYSETNYLKLTYGHWLYIILFYPIPFIGLIGAIIFAFKTFKKKHYRFQKPLFWKTLQIKDGRRNIGYREVNVLRPDDDQEEILQNSIPNKNKVYSIIALLVSVITLSFTIFQYNKRINSNEYKFSKLTEKEIKDLVKPNDTLVSKNNEPLVYIKVKTEISSYTDKVKKYDTTFKTFEQGYKTFKLKDKELGTFLFIDSSNRYGEKYVALKTFKSIDSISKLISNQKRVDSIFYVLLSDITIKPNFK